MELQYEGLMHRAIHGIGSMKIAEYNSSQGNTSDANEACILGYPNISLEWGELVAYEEPDLGQVDLREASQHPTWPCISLYPFKRPGHKSVGYASAAVSMASSTVPSRAGCLTGEPLGSLAKGIRCRHSRQ